MEEEYQRLRADWAAGVRDREQALHLLYLSWWHWAEPEFLTGLSDDPAAAQLWQEIFGSFGGEASSDAEFLFVAGIMAGISSYGLGDETHWEAVSDRLGVRARQLKPSGFPPEDFEGRGDFGEYFAHQARCLATYREI